MYIISFIGYVFTTIRQESDNQDENVSSTSNHISIFHNQPSQALSNFINRINLEESKFNEIIPNSGNLSFKTRINNVEEYIHLNLINPFEGLSSRIYGRASFYTMMQQDQLMMNVVSNTYFFNLNKILMLIYYIKPNSFVKIINLGVGNALYYIDNNLENPFIRFELFYYFNPQTFFVNDSIPNNQTLTLLNEENFVKYFNLFLNYLENFNVFFSTFLADNHDYFSKYTIIEEFPNLIKGRNHKATKLVAHMINENQFYLSKLIPEINWIYLKSYLYKSNCFLMIKMHSIFSLLLLKSLFSINIFYEIFVLKNQSTNILFNLEILRYRTILFLFYYNDPLFLGISVNQFALLFFSFLNFYNPYLLTPKSAEFILQNYFSRYFDFFMKRRRSYLLSNKYKFYVRSYFQRSKKEEITLEFLENYFDDISKNVAINVSNIVSTYFNNFINLQSDASFIDYINNLHEYLNKES